MVLNNWLVWLSVQRKMIKHIRDHPCNQDTHRRSTLRGWHAISLPGCVLGAYLSSKVRCKDLKAETEKVIIRCAGLSMPRHKSPTDATIHSSRPTKSHPNNLGSRGHEYPCTLMIHVGSGMAMDYCVQNYKIRTFYSTAVQQPSLKIVPLYIYRGFSGMQRDPKYCHSTIQNLLSWSP